MKTKLLLTAIAAFIGSALYAADVPPVGSAAPEFSAPDANGKTQSLSEYKGKYVVLEWFNPECPFVKKHYGGGNMQKLQKKKTGKGFFCVKLIPKPPALRATSLPSRQRKSWIRGKPNRPRSFSILKVKSPNF